MNKLIQITAWALVAGFFLVGCSYQRKVYLKHTDLPEHIYRIPLKNDYLGARVAIFNFREPPYAKGMGEVAAETLYHELLTNKVFVSVTHEKEVSDLRMENLLDFARHNDYNLIVTGDLLYYFEGSLQLPSRIDQRIRVVDTKDKTTLWYAKAVDIGPNAPYSDYYVVEGRGASAPTTRTLFARNANKFSKMLIRQPPQAFLNTVATTQESGHRGSDYDLRTGTESQTGARYLELHLEEDLGHPSSREYKTHTKRAAQSNAVTPADEVFRQPVEQGHKEAPDARRANLANRKLESVNRNLTTNSE
jgi:hypothetical protein